MSFFEELKRRNVFRVGIAYVLLGWVVMQAADFALDLIDAPNWIIQVFFIAGLTGLPIALFFAWAFEVTPEGIKREKEIDRSQSITPHTGRKLDRAIIAFLAIAVVLLLLRPYWSAETETATTAGPALEVQEPPTTIAAQITRPEKSVAVLPFVARSTGEDDQFFADGLTEEILNALAQLPELFVTARTSAFAFKDQDVPVSEIAEKLGVEHIVEGSVRHSGDRVRVTAQLVRATDGFQLWSESYDSTSTDTIAMQEDIAEQIATALDVVMDEDRRAAMRRVGLRNPAAFTLFQKGTAASREAHGAFDQITGLLASNDYFDAVLELVPEYAPAHTERADPYVHIINDAATNEPTLGNVPEDVMENAYELAVEAMTQARTHAVSLEARNSAEFDLAVLTGDFYRIRSRMETYLAATDCETMTWIEPMASVFGYAAELVERLEPVVECNPLGPVRRFSQARAAMIAGDPQLALELISAAREQVSHPWLTMLQVDALIAAGEPEAAELELQRSGSDAFYQFISGFKLAANQGDRQKAEEMLLALQEVVQIENPGGFLMLQYYAATGQRALANELAATIDAQAYGPLPLILVTLWCSCGAPFDLEATPNLAAKIEQGNLPWPPPSAISFPLKDW